MGSKRRRHAPCPGSHEKPRAATLRATRDQRPKMRVGLHRTVRREIRRSSTFSTSCVVATAARSARASSAANASTRRVALADAEPHAVRRPTNMAEQKAAAENPNGPMAASAPQTPHVGGARRHRRRRARARRLTPRRLVPLGARRARRAVGRAEVQRRAARGPRRRQRGELRRLRASSRPSATCGETCSRKRCAVRRWSSCSEHPSRARRRTPAARARRAATPGRALTRAPPPHSGRSTRTSATASSASGAASST